jgi:hypothetical protein
MEDFLAQSSTVLKYIFAFTFVISLIALFIYTLQRLTKRDLSDQTGWKNFKNPAIALLFISLAVQLILIVFASLYAA